MCHNVFAPPYKNMFLIYSSKMQVKNVHVSLYINSLMTDLRLKLFSYWRSVEREMLEDLVL